MSAARERVAHAPNSTVILGVVSAAATPELIAAILRPPAVAAAATRRYVAHGDAGPGRLAESRRPAARA